MQALTDCERNRQKAKRHYHRCRLAILEQKRTTYQENKAAIIAYKIYRDAQAVGRVPSAKTIAEHDIDTARLCCILKRFATDHPDTRAAKKIENM